MHWFELFRSIKKKEIKKRNQIKNKRFRYAQAVYPKNLLFLITRVIKKTFGEKVTKKGRPRKLTNSKNRVFSLVMTEAAALVIHKIKKNTIGNTKFIHKELSNYIVKHWGCATQVLLELQRIKNKELLELEIKVEEKRKEMNQIIEDRRKLLKEKGDKKWHN